VKETSHQPLLHKKRELHAQPMTLSAIGFSNLRGVKEKKHAARRADQHVIVFGFRLADHHFSLRIVWLAFSAQDDDCTGQRQI
jgi:hypothetical protein